MKKVLLTLLVLLVPIGPATAQNTIVAEDIAASVTAFVTQQLQGELAEDTRLEIETRWQGNVVVATGEPQIRVRRASSRPLRGPTVLRVGIDAGGQTQRAMSVTADIRHLRPVLVASRMLRRGEALTLDLVELVECDITQLRHGYFTDFEALGNMQTRRSVVAGDVLTRNHVEAIPVVHRGDEVELVARTNQLAVSALGQAMQDGGIGERIRVKNSDSGKILYGQIIDAATIQVGL